MRLLRAFLVLSLLLLPQMANAETLMMATTTSTQDTGLLEYLQPIFKKDTGIDLKWISVGTGKALAHGKDCDVDVLLVHAPALEEKFVADGFGVDRHQVMYNDFVLIGPAADPAGVKGKDIPTALKTFAEKKIPFVSRGDNSGTHNTEKQLWKVAGMEVPGKDATWYIDAGQGMMATIRIAAEKDGYTVTDRETGDQLDIENKYIMSPKDLKTIHFLNKMIDAGVTVFKIEGRARGPEYVQVAVECYSQAIDAICDGTYSDDKIAIWDGRLEKIFNRGFWNGYYLGQRLGEWSSKYGSSATRVKRYAAKGVRYFPAIGVGEFLMESGELHVGDEIIITGPTTGALMLTVGEIRVDLKPVDTVRKGESFSIKTDARIRPSDKLYVWDHTAMAKD